MASIGSCLCGDTTWVIEGPPEYAYHCHCSMCRKAHGAAFGTYYYMPTKSFHWTGSREHARDFASSPGMVRSFCSRCGSVVPNADDDGKHVFVPAGSHDDGPAIEAHIFAASKAPWYRITDALPQHDAFPPGQDLPVYETRRLSEPPEGCVRGSCLCGAVAFEVREPFKIVHNCYCMRCRRARSAAFTTNGFTSMGGVRFHEGEDQLADFKVPEARHFKHVFCGICGSGLPRLDPERNVAVTPFGALDDDPGRGADDNIFVGHRAAWFDMTDSLPAFEGAAPG